MEQLIKAIESLGYPVDKDQFNKLIEEIQYGTEHDVIYKVWELYYCVTGFYKFLDLSRRMIISALLNEKYAVKRLGHLYGLYRETDELSWEQIQKQAYLDL